MNPQTLETFAIIGVILGAASVVALMWAAAKFDGWIKESHEWPNRHISRNEEDIRNVRLRLDRLAETLGYKETYRDSPIWEKKK